MPDFPRQFQPYPLIARGLAVALMTSVAPMQAAAQAAAPPQHAAPLAGTLGADAARALGNPWKAVEAEAVARRRPNRASEGADARRHSIEGEFLLYGVTDAPAYQRGGSTLLVQPLSSTTGNAPQWYPSPAPPQWRVVTDAHPVQAWRQIEVTDVVCSANGACGAVHTMLLARWAPALRGYAFTDRLGRVWRVE
jgi:hypothetical protein